MNWLSQNWIWILLAVFVLFMLMRRGGGMMGCGMRHAHDERNPDTRMPPSGNADQAVALDPVTGKTVDKQRAATSFYRGRMYYFEGAESRKRFEESPERYASDGAAAQAPSSAAHRHQRC